MRQISEEALLDCRQEYGHRILGFDESPSETVRSYLLALGLEFIFSGWPDPARDRSPPEQQRRHFRGFLPLLVAARRGRG